MDRGVLAIGLVDPGLDHLVKLIKVVDTTLEALFGLAVAVRGDNVYSGLVNDNYLL